MENEVGGGRGAPGPSRGARLAATLGPSPFSALAAAAAPQPVVLHVEITTRRQAQVMLALVYLVLVIFVGFTITLTILKEDVHEYGMGLGSNHYYQTVLGLAVACMVLVLCCAAVFAARVRQMAQLRRPWPPRQKALATDAAVMLGLEILLCTFWLTPYAVVVNSECAWPVRTVAIFNVLHTNCLNLLLLWMAVMIHSMCLSKQGLAAARAPGGALTSLVDEPDLGSESPGNALSEGELSGEVVVRGVEDPCAEGDGQAGGAAGRSARAGSSWRSGSAHGGRGEVGSGGGCGGDTASGSSNNNSNSSSTATPAGQHPAPAAARSTEKLERYISQPQLGRDSDCQTHPLIIDLPWRDKVKIHLPKLVLWAIMETAAILANVHQLRRGKGDAQLSSCNSEVLLCDIPIMETVAQGVEMLATLVYMAMYFWYLRRAFEDHARLPYMRNYISNVYIRVQARYVTAVFLSIAMGLVLLVIFGVHTCWTFIHYQLGLPPTEIALVVLVLVSAFLYMPASGLGAPIVQAWLQEFAWTEASLPVQKDRRNRHLREAVATQPEALDKWRLPTLLPKGVQQQVEHCSEQLAREPMFCMETAIKCFYWTRLAKLYGVSDPFVTEAHALSLFGLQHCQCFKEPSTDSKGVVGWGVPGGTSGTMAVLSFRGTSSTTNVLHDIQLWSTRHEPLRRWRGLAVRVHAGFYKSWCANGFGERMLAKVEEIVAACPAGAAGLTLCFTGHSLGGALANLCAYEASKRWPGARLLVYTFGAPRVGNLAWVSEYNKAVPETWSVINQEDPVPRQPKFTYYPSGHRVTMNTAGDLIVRPSYFELSIIQRTGGSFTRHRNLSYSQSFAAVMRAQFVPGKALPGGEPGVSQLATSMDLGAALLLTHMDLASLRDPAAKPQALSLVPALRARRRQVALNLVKSLVRLGTSRDRRGSGASNGLGNGSLHSLGPLPEEEQRGEGEEARAGEGEGEGGGDATKGG